MNPQSKGSKHQVSPDKQPNKPQIEDFTYVCQLGRGAYGEVILVQRNTDQKQFAMKVIDKRFLMKEKKQYQVFIEREMLLYLSHPGIVTLQQTFQKPEKLYFVLEYLDGGDFADFLKLNRVNLKFEHMQFYLAEIVLILEYLHSKGIAHRDLKPENLMIANDGHIKLIDFGTASIVREELVQLDFLNKIKAIKNKLGSEEVEVDDQPNKRRATFVGTAEYVSPELLEEEECEEPADLWALGVICYKMFAGVTPFVEHSEFLVFQRIKLAEYNMNQAIPSVAADLISKLLVRQPSNRLGAGPNGYAALKGHPFFKGVNFTTLLKNKAPQLKVIKVEQIKDDIVDPDLEINQKKKTKLIFYGVVSVKIGWFIYQPLDLVLVEGKQWMKLVLYDPETGKCKSKIQLDDKVKVYNPSSHIMKIDDSNGKTHTFKEVEHPVSKWLDVIERSRLDLRKKLERIAQIKTVRSRKEQQDIPHK